MSLLQEQYRTKIRSELKQELKLRNVFAVPKIEKIVINSGIGRILQNDPKKLDYLVETMAKIIGQQPVKAKAKKSISAFKIRENQIIGLRATLRGERMYHFLEKLIRAALPRSRDFRGLSRKGFDGKGNYTLGLREHIIFPELVGEEGGAPFGLEITVVTSAENDDEGYALLKKLGFPFSEAKDT